MFGGETQALLGTLPSAAAAAGSAVYSTACYNHHIAEHVEFWTTATSDGVTQRDALSHFLSQGAGTPMRWVDDCTGYECGKGCSGAPA